MIVQTLLIRWMKNTRGEPYASLRTHQPAAFPLPTAIPTNPYPLEKERILVHRLIFHQTVKGIEQIDDTCEWLPMPAADIEIKHAKLPGLFPQRHAEYIAVRFGYDPSFGKPVRTDDRSGLLDELAFVLGKGQYGRIVINGRRTIEEGSVYALQTFNLWNTEDASVLNSDRLYRDPDYVRTYLASLW